MIFVHGWPEIGLMWRAQIEAFASEGWRCVAPDMRGYGGSSAPDPSEAYALREIVKDMVELHDCLGARSAIWVGHDLGSPVVGALAAHHAKRSRGVVFASVPYSRRLSRYRISCHYLTGNSTRRRVSGRTMGLLPLLPDPLRSDCHRLQCGHPSDSRGDLPKRESRVPGQSLLVSLGHAQWRLVRFCASRSDGSTRPCALASRRL